MHSSFASRSIHASLIRVLLILIWKYSSNLNGLNSDFNDAYICLSLSFPDPRFLFTLLHLQSSRQFTTFWWKWELKYIISAVLGHGSKNVYKCVLCCKFLWLYISNPRPGSNLLIYNFNNFDFVSKSKIKTCIFTRFLCLRYKAVFNYTYDENVNLIWCRLNFIFHTAM